MLGFLLGYIPAAAALYHQQIKDMQHSEAVATSKQIRVDLDAVLQRVKDHRKRLMDEGIEGVPKSEVDKGEVIAQHTLSQRAIEEAIMRQGMVLKNLSPENKPYPHSYSPQSPVIDRPTDVKL